jgi:hypothetical protein
MTKSGSPQIEVLTRLELYFSMRHTLRTMRQFAELFEHDYDLAMIFLTVVEVGLQAVFHLAAVNAQAVDIAGLYKELTASGLSIMNIGESTGIPRETVRRKVRRLIEMGYLDVREKDNNVYVPASTITKPRMLEILSFHVAEVGTLVRTIRFYSKDHNET